MSIDALGFHIGPVYLRFYGIILVTGALVGAYVASLEARRHSQDPTHVWDMLIWALIGGIVGARLYHVFTPPPSMVAAGLTTAAYFANPVRILEVWNGGLGIPGGVAGGLVGMWFYTRRQKLNFINWVDFAAPGLILGQAIGRWGNYVNQELYGRPTNLPWGIYIEPQSRVAGYAQFSRFHPTFLYESILDGFACLILLWLARRYADRLKPGDLFLFYLVFYPVVRFLMELLRLDSSGLGNLNINQTLALFVAVSSTIVLLIRHRRQRRARATAANVGSIS